MASELAAGDPKRDHAREGPKGAEMLTAERSRTRVRERRPRQHVSKVHGVGAEGEIKGREAILSVLSRAADDSGFLARLAEDPAEALEEYYTLTSEEKAALASGDMKKIESWVGKLDDRLATWLWCRLSQEKR